MPRSSNTVWQIGPDSQVVLDRPRFMGILNVTPDSFSDGGAYSTVQEAVAAAMALRKAGARIIDVGGESTRPGAAAVDIDEQIRRTVPVIAAIARGLETECLGTRDVFISIDTTRSAVAAAALDAGASIINDVSAGLDDPQMLELAASRQCGIILMHRLTVPRDDSYSTDYRVPPDYGGEITEVVGNFLQSRCNAAVSAGIQQQAIVIDPGLGFGKSVAQNYELIAGVRAMLETGFPVLSAASRKSFLTSFGRNVPPAQRDWASVAITIMHYLAGVRLFRVHNVAAHRQALDAAVRAIDGASAATPESLIQAND